MKCYKVVVLNSGNKYTYQGTFTCMEDAINYYTSPNSRVIEIKELGVRVGGK